MSHKQILQNRATEAERVYLAAAEESERIQSQVAADRQAIEELTAQYEQSCRSLATGASVDPAKILAERDRRSHRLRGLEALAAEANDAVQLANVDHVATSRALQGELDLEERASLEAAIVDANTKRDTAAAVLRDAEQVLNAAVWARSHFLRQLELKAKGIA